MKNRQPELPRPALMKIGELLRRHYETRVVPDNPALTMLAYRADAALESAKGGRHEAR